MNPGSMANDVESSGIPRVSGGEPGAEPVPHTASKYSPRERG